MKIDNLRQGEAVACSFTPARWSFRKIPLSRCSGPFELVGYASWRSWRWLSSSIWPFTIAHFIARALLSLLSPWYAVRAAEFCRSRFWEGHLGILVPAAPCTVRLLNERTRGFGQRDCLMPRCRSSALRTL